MTQGKRRPRFKVNEAAGTLRKSDGGDSLSITYAPPDALPLSQLLLMSGAEGQSIWWGVGDGEAVPSIRLP